MKLKPISVLLIAIIAMFPSCVEDMEQYQYSPTVKVLAGVLPDKIISVTNVLNTNISVLDTVEMGDTVRIILLLNGYGFNLTNFSINKGVNPSLIEILNTDSLGKIVTPDSNLGTMNFTFVSGIIGVSIPLNYMPGRSLVTDSLTIFLKSDITVKSDSVKRVLKIPVR